MLVFNISIIIISSPIFFVNQKHLTAEGGVIMLKARQPPKPITEDEIELWETIDDD